MYDMYPDWGPAHLRDSYGSSAGTASESTLSSVQHGLDLRDNGGQRPDDN